MASLTAYSVGWSPSAAKGTLTSSIFVSPLNPGARSGYPWPTDTATNVSWSPSAAKGTLTSSIFVSPLNPGARSGYPWPTDIATKVAWSPTAQKAVVGANLKYSYAAVPQITAQSTGGVPASQDQTGTSAANLPLITGSGSTPAAPASGTSAANLPLTTASSAGYTNALGTSAANSPLITAASSGITDSIGTSTATLPLNTAYSYAEIPHADSPAVLPLIVGSGTAAQGTRNINPLPLITGAGSGFAGEVGASTAQLPLMSGSGMVPASAIGSSAAILPTYIASGGTPPVSGSALPFIRASGMGVEGAVGGSATAMILPVGSGNSRVDGVCTSSCVTSAVQGAGVALNGSVGLSNATLSRIILASQGLSGVVSKSTVVLPVMAGSGTALIPVVGLSVAVQIPAIRAHSTAASLGTTQSTTVVMHTESQALSTYENYGFNSFTKFNGMYLGASKDGIFALQGDTDDGAVIDAMIRLGITDFGTEFSKRIDKMYVGYRASGDLVLRVIASDREYEYPLKTTEGVEIHGNRVQIGKGLDSRYWQFELRNVNGANFELNAVRVTPQTLSRRNR